MRMGAAGLPNAAEHMRPRVPGDVREGAAVDESAAQVK